MKQGNPLRAVRFSTLLGGRFLRSKMVLSHSPKIGFVRTTSFDLDLYFQFIHAFFPVSMLTIHVRSPLLQIL